MLHKTKLYQHFTVKELLYMFDTNGDGVLAGGEVLKMNDALLRKRREVDMQLAAQLSPRARTEVRTMFEKHDADGEGSLDTTELQTVLHAMGHAPTEQQLQSLLGEFDYDGSGALDVLEFTALMARLLGYRELPNEQTALLKRVFTYVDIDGDGKISVAELRAVIEKFGLKLTEGQLALYVREFDADVRRRRATPRKSAGKFGRNSAQFSDALPRTHLSGRRPLLGDGILLADGEAAGAGGPHRQPAEHLEGPPAHRAQARAADLDERGARAAGARRPPL